MEAIKIYVMAHQAFQAPENDIYIPFQVGAALHDKLGYARDDTGDHISEKNPYYSELTGFYWMWKNGSGCDITGLCHYRRYFLDENGELLSEKKIRQVLQEYDMIVSEMLVLENGMSVYEQYAKHHYGRDLDSLREALIECCPEYLNVYDEVMQGQQMYFGNMLIAPKATADAYAEWLFELLFVLEDRIVLSEYDDYNKRIFGFLSERLLLVWIRKNGMRACSMTVGVSSNKTETEAVCARAISILKNGDQKEVLRYLRNAEVSRPDVFADSADMEGILWQIRLFAELMDAEERMGKSSLKAFSTDFYELQKLLKKIAEYVKQLPNDDSFYRLVTDNGLSAESLILFFNMLLDEDEKEKKITCCNYLVNEALNKSQIEMARTYLAAEIIF